MYSNWQVVGIVLETMAASGNRRTDLVPWASSRCKFINWFRLGKTKLCTRAFAEASISDTARGHNNEVAAAAFVLNR